MDRTRGGRLLALPYPHEINDIPMVALHHATAAAFGDAIVDNFEEMRRQSEAQPLVYGISLHAFIAGQPFRLRHLRRDEAVAKANDKVWFATTGAIAEHYIGLALPEA